MSNNQEVAGNEIRISSWETMPNMFVALVAATIAPVGAFAVVILLIALKSVIELQNSAITNENSDVGSFIAIIWAGGFVGIIISAIHIVIFGLPAIVVGSTFKLIRWWSSIIVGFSVGFLPITIYELSVKGSSAVGAVQYMTDGIRTPVGWVEFWQIVLVMGFFGAVGGFTFWLVWRCLSILTNYLHEKQIMVSKSG